MKRSTQPMFFLLWASSILSTASAQEYLPPQPTPEMTVLFSCQEPIAQPANALVGFLTAQGFSTLAPNQLENIQGYSIDGDPFIRRTQLVAINSAGMVINFVNVEDEGRANYILQVYPPSEGARAGLFDVLLRHEVSRSGRCKQVQVNGFTSSKFDDAGYASLKARVQTAFRVAKQQRAIGSGAGPRPKMKIHQVIIHTAPGLPKITQTWSGDAVMLDLTGEPGGGMATVEPEPQQDWPALIDLRDLQGSTGFLTVRGALYRDFAGINKDWSRVCGGGSVKCPPGPYKAGSRITLSWK